MSLIELLPEIMITVGLLLILIFDLISKVFKSHIQISLYAGISAIFFLIIQWNLESSFLEELDKFSIICRGILVICAILCICIGTEYINRSSLSLTEFFIFLLGATIGSMCICQAKNIITVFVSLECLSISSYLLVGYTKRDLRSNEAAMKYLIMGSSSSCILAYGLSWLYGLSGGYIEFFDIANGIKSVNLTAISIALVTILVGLAFKMSLVPFHQWAPDVYEGAPTPVVAFLSVGSKVASLVLATRLLNIVFVDYQTEWHPILEVLSLLSMIGGNLLAVTQTSIKRMLAYSSISQLGYILVGLIASSSDGYASMLSYMIIYTFVNLGAFACIMVLGLRTGTDQIRDYTGLYLRDPWIAFSMTVCLLSLAGFPPLAGFFGKIYLFWSGWQSGLYLLVYTGLLTSVISMYYYLRVIKIMITPNKMSTYINQYSSNYNFNALEISLGVCILLCTGIGIVIHPIMMAAKQMI